MEIGAWLTESNSIGRCKHRPGRAIIRAMRLPNPNIAGKRALQLANRVASLVLPHRCLSCRTLMPDANGLCVDCWGQLTFLGEPCCTLCGYPFELSEGRDALCAACTFRRPAYDKARAVFAYDDTSRDLILAFKHGDHTENAPALAAWLVRAAGGLARDADIVAPVPLHRKRLRQRRFNQSALIAQQAARHWQRDYYPDLLQRQRATASQGNLGFSARRRNVRQAFGVSEKYRNAIEGRTILLIDDVLTTGATVEECSRILKRHGARQVYVATLARVPSPHTSPG